MQDLSRPESALTDVPADERREILLETHSRVLDRTTVMLIDVAYLVEALALVVAVWKLVEPP